MVGGIKMDKYEEYLEEKVSDAKNEIVDLNKNYHSFLRNYGHDAFINTKNEIVAELRAYEDALNAYRNLKAKGKI